MPDSNEPRRGYGMQFEKMKTMLMPMMRWIQLEF
jgi:hypothetical protein